MVISDLKKIWGYRPLPEDIDAVRPEPAGFQIRIVSVWLEDKFPGRQFERCAMFID
jgi:hypothetical protein